MKKSLFAQTVSPRGYFLVGLLALGLGACGPQPTGAVARVPPAATERPSEEIRRPALTVDEEVVRDRLKRHVEVLTREIGERSPQKLWELAESSDYLAGELEKLGFPVERQGYETADVAAQNLAITVHGGGRGDEILLVGAHYDSPPGSPGLNAGASGAAALLELARLMQDARLHRSLRIVFFAMGEAPHGDGEARGARHYAKKLVEEANRQPTPGLPEAVASVSRIVPLGLVHLDRIGVFRTTRTELSPRGVYLSLEASPGAEPLLASLRDALSGDPLRFSSGRTDLAGPDSDALAFYNEGIPVLSVHGESGGSEEALNFEEMAQVVMRLRFGIGELLGEMPTNDGMVTPLGSGIR